MSPRRSSRARSSANPQPAPSQTGSSNSSTNLKNTRTAQRSESIDDSGPVDDDASTEPIMPRRSRRNGAEDSREESQNAKQEDGLEEEPEPLEDDPEEVTRCICGRLDYPGPTTAIPFIAEEKGAALADLVNKDTGDFFVQCDKCLVWQHGGCMGFHDEGNLPEEYYCELCKPKLHSIQRTPQGKRSRYVPPQQTQPQADSSRSSSLSASDARKKEKEKENEKQALAESTKRRATMNSRGAYDEDEMLRRAIEESSKDSGTLGKRTRDDVDDSKKVVKRQRTGSLSSDSKGSASPPGTDDGTTRAAGKSKQSLRGTAVRNNKEREAREKAKEQQVAARAEAANKRNARSERRRGEDSPPPSPSISPSKAFAASSQKAKDKADTPPVTSKPAVKSKNARTNRGGRRVGRNQYTKDRDLNGNVDSDTPMRDTGDANGNTNGRNSPGHNNINGESGRSSKAKTHPARTSLNEMKRRVAAILEFVGQMQTQASRQSTNGKGSDKSGSGSEKGTPTGGAVAGVASLVKAVQAATEDIAASNAETENEGDVDVKGKLKFRDDADFRDMGSAEMMEALTRELIAWQRVYGVYSR